MRLHRLFVGLSIPKETKQNIARATLPLPALFPTGRFIAPEQWHATLSFLPDQSGDDIRKILIVLEETARAFPPQNVFFDKIVLGPLDRAPTMIWALGNKITSYEMGKIKEFLGKGFGDAGVRAHGENPHHFIAHITLACSNGNIVVPPEYIFPSLEAEFTAPTLELFESVKENGKREYIPLTSFDFTDGAS